MRDLALTLVLVLYFACLGFLSAAKPHTHAPVNTYERTVNVTLDAVQWAHDTHKGNMTWAELNEAVCKYMKVKRTQPWERK